MATQLWPILGFFSDKTVINADIKLLQENVSCITQICIKPLEAAYLVLIVGKSLCKIKTQIQDQVLMDRKIRSI